MYLHVSFFRKQTLFLFFLFSFAICAKSQITLKAPAHVCIGNLAYFDGSSSSGINAYKWDFGDGFSSVSKAPFHLYKTAGSYTVRLSLKLNNGSTVTDSARLEVDELPKAIMFKDGPQDSCLFTNQFTFVDRSTPAKPGQNIDSRLILWGDGHFDKTDNRGYADKLQHHYKLKDIYLVKMEVTDNRGCKSSVTSKVKVINGTRARIKAEITYPGCGEAMVCFRNESQTSNGIQTYNWNFDSTGFKLLPYTQETCFKTSNSKYVRAYLELSNPDKTCKSEAYVKVYLDAEGITNNLTQSDTSVCYGTKVPLELRNSASGYTYAWTLNGSKFSGAKDLEILPKYYNMFPGTYFFECKVSKGPCNQTYKGKFSVTGPVAKMKVFNREQCEIEHRVFFVDSSRFIDRKNALYTWTIIDPEGENCIINRAQNINKYKNCNISKDWFGKHDYTIPRDTNRITLEVTDILSGCKDVSSQFVEHFHCKLCFCRGGGPVAICQYDSFLPLREKEIGPKFFSLDTGKTWLKFPSIVPKPYKGMYGVGFIFENSIPDVAEDFGDDSIRIYRHDTTWMDTIFAPDFLYVKETKSTEMDLKLFNKCKPFKAAITLKDSSFKAGDTTIIDWADGTKDTIGYARDTIVKQWTHAYDTIGLDSSIRLELKSAEGCTRYKKLKIRFGKKLVLRTNGSPCKNNNIYFSTEITETYNDSTMKVLKSIAWKLEKDTSHIRKDTLCLTYDSGGKKMITLIAEDSLGCMDTMEKIFMIRDVKAGVTNDTRTFYCSELKQLFDSSYHIHMDDSDYIADHFWDFGSGMYTTTEKDPFKVFDMNDSFVHIRHIVVDNSGCTDTFPFKVRIIGSLPKFSFTDTMGCAPFKVTFKNLSKKCSSYIWEFDDPDNTTNENHDHNDVSFTYNKPGFFYPKLIGIDTFYNEYTGSVYYCHTNYDPGKLITVYKTLRSTLEGDDTICLGTTAKFSSTSDDVLFNRWDFGDGTKGSFPVNPSEVKHIYNKEGKFRLKVVPGYNFMPGTPVCMDSNTIDITVIGVYADFEIDSKSDAPIFYFNNMSRPSHADLMWNFGQPSSGSRNTSTLQDPSHNYGTSNGQFTICLVASVLNKCRDTICKPVVNDYTERIKMFNVFTPGNNDSLNDEFDLILDGEKEYSLIIYDRWGVPVYKSDTDGQLGDGINWNGRVNNTGNTCPNGTYYYILNFTYKGDPEKKHLINGTVTLIRH